MSTMNPQIDGSPPPVSLHPLRRRARVLLTSVFGPYAQDDEYGSRRMNPMELYHNQVTRAQGPFSLRMFHRSWGLMLIQANIEAPCTLLDFPTLDRFIEEIRTHQYDVVGITSIIPNVLKVQEDVRVDPPVSAQRHDRHRRAHRQRARPGASGSTPTTSSAARACAGSAASWARDADRPIRHPLIISGFGTRNMGVQAQGTPRRRGRHGHPLGGLPAGLQLLLHLGHVRRQGQVASTSTRPATSCSTSCASSNAA